MTEAYSDRESLDDLPLSFRPLHKRAFGMAVGSTLGVFLFVVTAYAVIRGDSPRFVYLLASYFPGYTVSWVGAIIGTVWAAFAFFVAAWFCAFVRNLVITTSVWLARTRSELAATRDFLDHI